MHKLLFVLVVAAALPGCIRACNEAEDVAFQEAGPKALLKKYEWFKDAAAELDKKRADIDVYNARIVQLDEDYAGKPRSEWDRTDKETYNQWQTELAGVKASYNKLAAEYNAAMAKVNYRFANVGELPPGATDPLPREFKPYVEE